MTPLLLVEDDRNLAASLIDFLSAEGFSVRLATSRAEARRARGAGEALVLLDWMLPDGPGVDLLRAWRAAGDTLPIVLLTARTELVDRVLGLELGADDYILKPFEPRELLARLRARLRAAERDATGSTAPARLLTVGPLSLDVERREARLDGRALELSRQEWALLHVLMESPGRVFSREELLNRAWGHEHYPTTRTVDTHVLQLRQKVGAERIETLRGIGYRLRTPEDFTQR